MHPIRLLTFAFSVPCADYTNACQVFDILTMNVHLFTISSLVRVGNGAGDNRSWQLTVMIWPKNFVRFKSHLITRFSRRVWDPQKFILKLHRMERKLHRVQSKLRTIKNAHNRQ